MSNVTECLKKKFELNVIFIRERIEHDGVVDDRFRDPTPREAKAIDVWEHLIAKLAHLPPVLLLQLQALHDANVLESKVETPIAAIFSSPEGYSNISAAEFLGPLINAKP